MPDTINSNMFFEGYSWIYGELPGYGAIGRLPYYNNDPDSFAYIDLKFIVNNETHYGWVKIKTNGESDTIDSYAYNGTEEEIVVIGQTN